MAMVNSTGSMVEATLEAGKKASFMVKVYIIGLMVKSTKVNI